MAVVAAVGSIELQPRERAREREIECEREIERGDLR